MPARLTASETTGVPEMHEILASLRAEGLHPYRWDNDPHFTYPPHQHGYHKVLVCLRGSIRFVLTRENDEALELTAGNRLEIDAGTQHSAFVGPGGVACLEAHR